MLQQKDAPRSRKYLWIIIGIIIGVVAILIMILLYAAGKDASTYPYIPTPKHSARSTSFHDLISNILMDAGDTAVEYSVISRSELTNPR
jgi:flagellar basal body-associated protein FliL